MIQDMPPTETHGHYFIDESGDGILFDRKGRVIIGQEGCSRFFILGLLMVEDPQGLTEQMSVLRLKLIADPYFQGVPSFDPQRKKTALAFHAKDDLPEVRREVFSLLHEQTGLHFHAVIRDKFAVLEYVVARQKNDPDYRYQPDELYDFMVRRLTKPLLHKHSEYHITFASRGKRNRSHALLDALQTAQDRYDSQSNQANNSTLHVVSAPSRDQICLQAVDYFLWALQRLLVFKEDRYWNYLQPLCSLVVDLDDNRKHRYGQYYSKKEPLTLAALTERDDAIDLHRKSEI